MTERPDIPDSEPKEQPSSSATPRPRPRPTPTTARPVRPRERPQFESRRVRRTPTVAETPWYNNWRLLVPIVLVIILAIVMLGFALGQNSSRAAAPTPAAPGGAAPVIQVTAGSGQSIPIEIVTSTPAPAGGAAPKATP